MLEKRQRNTNVDDWYVFELMSQHWEYKTLHTYEQWMNAYWMELC